MFKFHLVPLVLVELFVLGNMVNFSQNGDKHEPRKQVDVAGPLGPTGQRSSEPPRRRPAPPGANLARSHVTDPWEPLQNQWDALI